MCLRRALSPNEDPQKGAVRQVARSASQCLNQGWFMGNFKIVFYDVSLPNSNESSIAIPEEYDLRLLPIKLSGKTETA